ncbi:hypothetical protein AB0L40_04110 [Patulibacter sp. NPDC049589]|uniref:hypothetical protein n=1 Tax=Patulibacter sp. NPDC049589 TaxID=3154731 RepID=UPI003412B795
MRPSLQIGAVALAVGVTCGAVVAVALPDDSTPVARVRASTTTTAPSGPRATTQRSGRAGRPTPTPLKRVVAVPAAQPVGSLTPVRPTVVRRVVAARPEPTRSGAIHLRVRGTIRVEARVADPGGGPAWAVRVFDADRTFDEADGTTRTIGHNRCAQLGRIHRGRFGWLDGEGTFRPTRPSLFTSETVCGSRRPDVNSRPRAEVLRTTSGLRSAEPHLAATVLWGRLGPAAGDVDVRFGARRDATTAGPDGVVLRVGSPDLDPRTVSVTARYGRGTRVEAADPGGLAARLAVRAADPAGGMPYGLSAARGSGGAWCVGPVGRVVDGRSGTLNFRLGTFTEHTGRAFGCAGGARDGRAVPVQSSGGEDLGAEPMYAEGAPAPGRVARRTPPGLAWTAGQARADVRSLTFRTPSDVRTLNPAGPAHAFLVVYAGRFPAGSSELVATLRSGKEQRSPLFLDVR